MDNQLYLDAYLGVQQWRRGFFREEKRKMITKMILDMKDEESVKMENLYGKNLKEEERKRRTTKITATTTTNTAAINKEEEGKKMGVQKKKTRKNKERRRKR